MDGRVVVRITLVSSPSGLEMTTVFRRLLSAGRAILSKYFGEMKE